MPLVIYNDTFKGVSIAVLIKQWLPCTLKYESRVQFEDHGVFVYTVKGHSNEDLYIWFTT